MIIIIIIIIKIIIIVCVPQDMSDVVVEEKSNVTLHGT